MQSEEPLRLLRELRDRGTVTAVATGKQELVAVTIEHAERYKRVDDKTLHCPGTAASARDCSRWSADAPPAANASTACFHASAGGAAAEAM